MPLGVQGRYVALGDGHVASLALEREHAQVARLAVRLQNPRAR